MSSSPTDTITCLPRGNCYDFQGRSSLLFQTHHISINQNDENIVCCSNGNNNNPSNPITIVPELGLTVSPDNSNLMQFTGSSGVLTVGTTTNTLDFRDLRNWTPFVVGLNPLVSSEYSSIQTAINDASTLAVSSGNPQLVLIQAGSYTENLTMVDNVHLLGVSQDSTTVQGTILFPNTLVTVPSLQQMTVQGTLNVNGFGSLDHVTLNGTSLTTNTGGPGRGPVLTIVDSRINTPINMTNGGLLTVRDTIVNGDATFGGAGLADVGIFNSSFTGALIFTSNSIIQAYASTFAFDAGGLTVSSPMTGGWIYFHGCHLSGDMSINDTTCQLQGITFVGCRLESTLNTPNFLSSDQCIVGIHQTGVATFSNCYLRCQTNLTESATLYIYDSELWAINGSSTLVDASDINMQAASPLTQGLFIFNSQIYGRIDVQQGNLTLMNSYVNHEGDTAIFATSNSACDLTIIGNTFFSNNAPINTPAINNTIGGVSMRIYNNKFITNTSPTNAVFTVVANNIQTDTINTYRGYVNLFSQAPTVPNAPLG